jgi:hypothetical protein
MRTFIPFAILFLLAKVGITQSISTQMGARSSGLGYTTSGIADEWSLFHNPGGLGKSIQTNTAFAYEVKSQLKGANRMAAVFNTPLPEGTVSAGFFKFGDDLYNEQTISVGFGNTFGIAALGAKLNLIQYYAEGFGVSHALSIDFGGITELTEKLFLNAYITNLTQSHIGEDNQLLPTRLTTGISFRPEKNIFISTEICKELEYSTTWRTGIEYSYQQKVFFRTGFNLKPNAGFFGVGIHKKKVRIDYGVQLNQLIGSAHQASAGYWFNRKDKK